MNELVLPLFPSVLYMTELDFDYDKRFEEFKELEFNPVSGAHGGNIKSYISVRKDVLETSRTLKTDLTNRFAHFKDEYLRQLNLDFEISTSWVTKTSTSGYSNLHSHRNSWYSGVLYFDSIPHGGNLEIESPARSDYMLHPIPDEETNELNAEKFVFTPSKNAVIFFPSYLRHIVTEHRSTTDRYSLAFNIIPVNQYGTGDSTTNIHYVR